MRQRIIWSVVNVFLLMVIAFQVSEAQTLQPVADGGSNLWLLVGFVIFGIVAVGGGLYLYYKRSPTVSAQATPSNGELVDAIELMLERVVKMQPVSTFQTSPYVEPATAVVIGKANQPGTFTIEVTGDPAKDLPAINAQYFG